MKIALKSNKRGSLLIKHKKIFKYPFINIIFIAHNRILLKIPGKVLYKIQSCEYTEACVNYK